MKSAIRMTDWTGQPLIDWREDLLHERLKCGGDGRTCREHKREVAKWLQLLSRLEALRDEVGVEKVLAMMERAKKMVAKEMKK
jgi:hypothetical protein